LAGVAPLELPTDKPRPAVRSNRGATLPVRLPRELAQRVGALARQEGVTPFMLLLAVWQALLGRYSGQQDISVGIPIAGRQQAEVEGLIGFFVNTLVARTQVEGEKSFKELLAQVKETTLGAYAHQDVPFERLVEELRPERDLGRTPLFQVFFALENTPVQQRERFALRPIELQSGTAKFDLSLSLREGAEGLTGWLEYSTDLYEPQTVERLVGHYQRLLESAVAQPDTHLSRLQLLGEEERRQVLTTWNPAPVAAGPTECVQALFEAQAERTPEAVAVVGGGRQVTYRQLDEEANRLAHRLRRLGVGPEVRVGLWMERSVEMVVGMLATLKAGGAYVPVDADYPEARARLVLEDSGLAVLLSEQPLLARFASLPEGVVSLALDTEELGAESAARPSASATPANAAYVIYTSGSTGRPKGVVVEHRQLWQLVRWHLDAYALGVGDRTSQVASPAFDAAVWEIWPTLASGAALELPERDVRLEPARLVGWLAERGITVAFLPTPLCEAVLAEPWPAESRLRWLLTGGDRLSRRPAPGAPFRLVNHYGPTEATVVATAGEVLAAQGGREPHIGGPITHARAYVLDEQRMPQPVGVPGELHVGGEGVARGYLERAELTAERFVRDPFSQEPGARMYRTGDRVRWLADGTLEFLGRMDSQVKLRGYRIELGEIEAVLAQHAGVLHAAVVVKQQAGGPQRLVGYVAPRPGQGVEGEEVRAFLRARLPEYMVPSALMVLEALPLSPNGKVDRKALPEPEAHALEVAFEAPRTPTETALAELWVQVLGAQRVGRNDDFFELGGHSLMATQMQARIRAGWSVELPLRAMFEAPTLKALAERIDGAKTERGRTALVAVGREGPLPLSFAQQRLWFLDRLEPGSALYNIPLAVRLEGALDEAALEKSLGEVVRRHEALRTSFEEVEGQPVQRIHPARAFELRVEDLREVPAEQRQQEARARMGEEARRPFELSGELMMRALLLRLEEREHVLVVNMHHIASDGWSVGVLSRELGALYEEYAGGRAARLAPLSVQYADYAVWQREWLRGEVLEKQVEYWKQKLAGVAPLELPTDKPRPAVRSNRGATLPVRLPRELAQRVGALAKQEGVTPFMLLLAAFQLLLARYSGQEDIVVGSPIAGRRQAEVEGLIGFFVNTLVLRTQVEGEKSFKALLAQVKETTLGAYEHQDVPFEKLVEELQPARDLSRTPLFQALFVLQNTPMQEVRLPGLTLHPLEAHGGEAAKFDLNLNLSETPEGFSGFLQVSTDLFTEATAARMVRHFHSLLDAVAAHPEGRLSALPWLPAEEREQVLRGWNGTAVETPSVTTFPAAFELQAASTPDAPAVRFEDEVLSFAGLNAHANQLAHQLRALGVGPDVPVALCFERSVDMVVALLGVMKAGGAYVPLDPSWPSQRLGFTLQDCAAPVLLTQRHLESSWVPVGTHVLFPGLDEALPSHNPEPSASADDLAYVIYTSGSTGRPKGVMVQHRSVLNLRHALARTIYAGQPSGLRVSVNAPLAFDASVKQLVQLLDGHCLCIVPEETRQDPDAMREWLRRYGVDVLDCTPSLLRLLVQSGLLQEDAAPRLLVPGGEAIDDALWEQLAAAPRTRTFNVYGPTECTVDTTAFAVRPGTRPTLGGPLANVRVYVLDAYLQPVPVGVPGELFISGAGLARGYLRRPDLTAERFLADPFSQEPGARMYRTGDRVRWRQDGTLEYLGRTDFQVKLRGFRIELGEIEAALAQHPEVRQAVVRVREDVPGNQRLVAWLTHPGAAPEVVSLRDFLKQRLPEYMVPAAFVPLDAIPLTPNGKVDARALPAPEASALATPYEAPVTPTEERLAAVWSEVLGVERVGRNDNFFELGGHSLLATQVVSRVRSVAEVELPLRELFESPTVAGLAARVEALSRTGTRGAPPLRPVPRTGPLPLSFAQQRLWFLDRLEPGSALYNIPLAVRLEGALDEAALEKSLGEVVRRHEALRTSFEEVEGQPVQRIHPARAFELRVEDLREVPAEQRQQEARARMGEEARRPFELSGELMMRALLLRLEEREH
ncbi:amino acid adenylation domain-containing protein, partial [Myxococcus sp. K15C18031901]|uniref:non-ribosomal peptide synthetase n=1 Tax=Myxococcus dinghuensis TaxID=2906761 RepID=UPI0020A78743